MLLNDRNICKLPYIPVIKIYIIIYNQIDASYEKKLPSWIIKHNFTECLLYSDVSESSQSESESESESGMSESEYESESGTCANVLHNQSQTYTYTHHVHVVPRIGLKSLSAIMYIINKY